MSLGVVRPAVRQGRHGTLTLVASVATVAIGLGVKCFPQYALSVARTQKCPSSPETTDQSIVGIAIIESEQDATKGYDAKQTSGARVSSSPAIF